MEARTLLLDGADPVLTCDFCGAESTADLFGTAHWEALPISFGYGYCCPRCAGAAAPELEALSARLRARAPASAWEVPVSCAPPVRVTTPPPARPTLPAARAMDARKRLRRTEAGRYSRAVIEPRPAVSGRYASKRR